MICLPEPIPTTMLLYHARSSLKYTWSSWKKHIGRGWNWQKTLLDLNSRKVGVCAAVSQGSCDRTVLRFYQVGLISTNSRNLHKKRLNLRILLARFGRTQSRTLLYWGKLIKSPKLMIKLSSMQRLLSFKGTEDRMEIWKRRVAQCIRSRMTTKPIARWTIELSGTTKWTTRPILTLVSYKT